MNKHWRGHLQAEINDTARLRSVSIYRQGDDITSTEPCLEGAGRARDARKPTIGELIVRLANWYEAWAIPPKDRICALESMLSDSYTTDQKKWLERYIKQWDEVTSCE